MKKIYIDKSDSVASVIEKILSTEDDSIVLHIPRFTKLGSSNNNFRLLKREIDSSGKNVEIESVDEEVLGLSKSVGINSSNPFFRKNHRAVSDILRPEASSATKVVQGIRSKKAKIEITEEEDVPSREPENEDIKNIEDTEDTEDTEDREETEDIENEHKDDAEEKNDSDGDADYYEETPKRQTEGYVKPRANNKVKILIALGVLLALCAAILLALFVLPRATVKVSLEQKVWDFSGSLVASVAIKDAYISNGQVKIAGEVFERTKNITNAYPATGSETVSRKATGNITIYNAYSSDAQPLVKDTRFESPDGKIFRITKGVTVPGAKIVNNKIAPSSIEVAVVADKPGVEYNIDAARFRIPGLKGSPKYDGFYGESVSPMSGGFVGVTKVPTSSDIIKAKDKNQKLLEAALDSEDSLSVSSETKIKIIENASRFIILKEDVDTTTDADGQFKLTTSAVKKIFGFIEEDLISVLKNQVVSEIKIQETNKATSSVSSEDQIDLVIKDYLITYGTPNVDFDKKQMSTTLKFKSTWIYSFDIEKFRDLIMGKKESDFSGEIKKIPGIEFVNVTLWPFWVSSVPNKPEKVSIDVQ